MISTPRFLPTVVKNVSEYSGLLGLMHLCKTLENQ